MAAGRRGERISTPGLEAATSMRLSGQAEAGAASMSGLARSSKTWSGQAPRGAAGAAWDQSGRGGT
ncbi:hypothetical protein LDDCCGHA_4056 [Methylobacterium oxalidis]|nr:hypothetical protein LDDCCGHA_4056 [Methylobacterium oxalidis]